MSYADSRAFLEADAFELLEVGCLYFPRVTGSLVLLHPWHMGSTVLNAFFSSSTTEMAPLNERELQRTGFHQYLGTFLGQSAHQSWHPLACK